MLNLHITDLNALARAQLDISSRLNAIRRQIADAERAGQYEAIQPELARIRDYLTAATVLDELIAATEALEATTSAA